MIFRSIRWRIAVPYVLLVLVTMTGLGVILTLNLRETRLQDLEARLLTEARMVGEAATPILQARTDLDDLDPLVRRWGQVLGSRVTIIAPDGLVLGESDEDRMQMDNHLNRPEVQQALAEGQGNSVRFSRTLRVDMMYAAIPLTSNQQVLGFVRVALPLQQIQAEEVQLRRTILLTTAVAALIAVVMGTIIAARTTLPLRKLTGAVDRLARAGLRERLVPPTQDEVGRLTRSFNTMAARLQTEFDNLEAERAKLAAVLHQMTDGVLMVDDQGRVQVMNTSAEHLFAIPSGKAVGQTLVEIVRHHQLVELWRRCRETSENQIDTYEFGPNQIFLQAVAIPFDSPLAGYVLLLLQDLTHMRRLETIRRDFVSNISHELRTPLASLKALVETLVGGALEDPQASRRFLERIEAEVDSLSQMVQELLELSRIESGKVPLQLQPVRPQELVDRAYERLRLQFERAELAVTLELPEDIPAILADPTRIEQVLVNLLHNALKFTPQDGQVVVGARSQENQVLFFVQDTGIGIPSDDLPRIFERFYKTDRARSGGGTGLGLAIARHLVEAHGGNIWAESREGEGSTFSFTIPAA